MRSDHYKLRGRERARTESLGPIRQTRSDEDLIIFGFGDCSLNVDGRRVGSQRVTGGDGGDRSGNRERRSSAVALGRLSGREGARVGRRGEGAGSERGGGWMR